MVLRLKTWESRSLPGLPNSDPKHASNSNAHSPKGAHKTARLLCFKTRSTRENTRTKNNAGWSSPVARQAHNLKVVSSNLAPATNKTGPLRGACFVGRWGRVFELTVRTKPRSARRSVNGEAGKSGPRNHRHIIRETTTPGARDGPGVLPYDACAADREGPRQTAEEVDVARANACGAAAPILNAVSPIKRRGGFHISWVASP